MDEHLERMERQRQLIRDKIANLHRMLGETDARQPGREFDAEGDALDEERGSDAKEIRTATRNAIERLGRPVKRADVLKELSRNGIVLSAAEPGKAVNRNLYRSKDMFVRVKEGYVLREQAQENG